LTGLNLYLNKIAIGDRNDANITMKGITTLANAVADSASEVLFCI